MVDLCARAASFWKPWPPLVSLGEAQVAGTAGAQEQWDAHPVCPTTIARRRPLGEILVVTELGTDKRRVHLEWSVWGLNSSPLLPSLTLPFFLSGFREVGVASKFTSISFTPCTSVFPVRSPIHVVGKEPASNSSFGTRNLILSRNWCIYMTFKGQLSCLLLEHPYFLNKTLHFYNYFTDMNKWKTLFISFFFLPEIQGK